MLDYFSKLRCEAGDDQTISLIVVFGSILIYGKMIACAEEFHREIGVSSAFRENYHTWDKHTTCPHINHSPRSTDIGEPTYFLPLPFHLR